MTGRRHTEVRMWDMSVGRARWNDDGNYASFQYDPTFLEKGIELAPITMPLTNRIISFESLPRETYNGLPGMLSDSLPDKYGNSLISVWLSKNKIPTKEFTPLDRLCYVGNRGMGALEYRPAIGDTEIDERLDVDMLASLASEIMMQRETVTANIEDRGLQKLLNIGTSAGGARAKAVIGLNESTGDIRSGQLDLPSGYDHWLLKFDTEEGEKKGYCRIEYTYHEMAKGCGIDMTECRLLNTGENIHFMTKRFDRVNGGKMHMQTLCALAHYDFMFPGRYSYEDLMTHLLKLHLPYVDRDQLFRRMVFNVIMRNQDDHTKNFSFLMDRTGKWRLSPAYDITYANNPENFWIRQHQMSVNGKLTGITRKDLEEFGHNAGIKKMGDIIDRTISMASEWKQYAKESEVPLKTIEAIDKELCLGL